MSRNKETAVRPPATWDNLVVEDKATLVANATAPAPA
jgi:hypothetical protein